MSERKEEQMGEAIKQINDDCKTEYDRFVEVFADMFRELENIKQKNANCAFCVAEDLRRHKKSTTDG